MEATTDVTPGSSPRALSKRANYRKSSEKMQEKELTRALLALLRDRLEFLLLDVKIHPRHIAAVLGLKAGTISTISQRARRKRALRTTKSESSEETLARQAEEKRVRVMFEAMMATITSKKKRMNKETNDAVTN
ncbi:unnamed protein product [Globisporangium polare]